ncbi:hypothetical protein [Actinophytocola xanthii]|uniref:PE domain-containing protein n=1 Tax=Actinophytocola xanthii TaxID=1912961 RepID=A0A1Q8CQW5_9PSEU|nr:hypothetical protein [Actinophytocola xanthii]OLF16749.1 hypothetical protein BU204_14870 [Actinophytocola xanthii]
MTTEPGHPYPPIGYPADQSHTRGGDAKVYIDTGRSDEPGRMIVDPEKLMQLKQGIEAERDRVREWLFRNRVRLEEMGSPGADPCSIDATDVVTQNGGIAIDKGDAYVQRLTAIIGKMHESAVTYGLVEDTQNAAFQRGPA